MQVLVHGAVFESVDGGAMMGVVGGGEVLYEGGEADADLEGIHFAFRRGEYQSCVSGGR